MEIVEVEVFTCIIIVSSMLVFLLFHVVGLGLVRHHFAVRILLFSSLANRCWPYLPNSSSHVFLRGFANLKNSEKSKKKWIELTPPTYPIQTFFGNPSLTWTEHSDHNNQQVLAMYGILLQNISPGLGLFWTIFHKKIRVRPPTSIVISEFWRTNFFAKPLRSLVRQSSHLSCAFLVFCNLLIASSQLFSTTVRLSS